MGIGKFKKRLYDVDYYRKIKRSHKTICAWCGRRTVPAYSTGSVCPSCMKKWP